MSNSITKFVLDKLMNGYPTEEVDELVLDFIKNKISINQETKDAIETAADSMDDLIVKFDNISDQLKEVVNEM